MQAPAHAVPQTRRPERPGIRTWSSVAPAPAAHTPPSQRKCGSSAAIRMGSVRMGNIAESFSKDLSELHDTFRTDQHDCMPKPVDDKFGAPSQAAVFSLLHQSRNRRDDACFVPNCLCCRVLVMIECIKTGWYVIEKTGLEGAERQAGKCQILPAHSIKTAIQAIRPNVRRSVQNIRKSCLWNNTEPVFSTQRPEHVHGSEKGTGIVALMGKFHGQNSYNLHSTVTDHAIPSA
jgi:hypothetical protein